MKSLPGIWGIWKLIKATYGRQLCECEHMNVLKTQYQPCHLTKQYNMVKHGFKGK